MGNGASAADITDMAVIGGMAALAFVGIAIITGFLVAHYFKARDYVAFLNYLEEIYVVDRNEFDWALVRHQKFHFRTLKERTKREWGDGEGQINTFEDVLKWTKSDLDVRPPA